MAKSALATDIERGSRIRIGVQDFEQTRAVRRMFIQGLDGTRADVDDAADFVRWNYNAHPYNSTLTLSHVDAEYWAPTKARVLAYYGYGKTSTPPLAAFSVVEENIFRFQRRSTIVDLGSLDPLYDTFFNGGQILIGKKLPATQIRVYTVLDTDPRPSIVSLYDQLNNDCVEIGGYSRAVNTLRFVGASVKDVVVAASNESDADGLAIKKQVNYIFHWLPQTWVGAGVYINAVRFPDAQGNLPPLYELEERRAADWAESAFANQFPVHTHGGDSLGPETGTCS